MIRRKRSKNTRTRTGPNGFVVGRLKQRKATKRTGSSRDAFRSLTNRRLQAVIDKMKAGNSLTSSARQLGVQPKTVRQKLKTAKLIQKRKGHWVIREKISPAMRLYSEGEEKWIVPSSGRGRSEVGKYMNAVKTYLRTNKRKSLTPFIDKSVRDIAGIRHRFETDENTLYRLASSSSEAFESIYKYVI